MIHVPTSSIAMVNTVPTVSRTSGLPWGGKLTNSRSCPSTATGMPASNTAPAKPNTRQGARSVPAGVWKICCRVRLRLGLSRRARSRGDQRLGDVEGRELGQAESDGDDDRPVEHRQMCDAADEDERDPRARGEEANRELLTP